MKIYYGNLYRFGYDLTVVDTTEAKVKAALMKEYKKTYKQYWGTAPSKEEIECVKDELYAIEMIPGKVEWL